MKRTEEEKVAFWAREFHRSNGEEWANAMSHFAGFVFGIFALTYMVIMSSLQGDARKIVSSAIFGFTLVFLYNSSALYHLVWKNSVKEVLQKLDHISIYLLIAGTYTPYCLVVLREEPKICWTVLGTTWILAVFGILQECLFEVRREWLSCLLYLAMGWQIIFVVHKVIAHMNTCGWIMLFVGGGVYTLGVIFYAMDRVPFMHTVWHFFVLGGSVCHWVSITFGC